MIKKHGFTLIELLAVIVILAVIAIIATPIILGIINDSKKGAFKASAYGISQAAKNTFIEIMYAGSEPKDITYTYINGAFASNPEGYSLNYEGDKPKNGQVILTKEGKVSLILHDGKYCATKGTTDAEVIIEEKSLEECMPPVVDQSGSNTPVLTTGMTAIVWDGNAWVTASNIDDPYKQNWYDYEEQKWANAITNDGSMWVWIPRYAYKITSGYHTATTGTIEVKFLKNNTNISSDGTAIVDVLSGGQTSADVYVKHPAFKFGDKELTGMWVAKFEASGTTSSLDSKPGVQSLKNITLGSMFTASRNMETNSKYGWELASTLNSDGTFATNTNNLDTHVMKNTEWGMVAYLSKSIYGKNAEITENTSASYYTGGGSGNAYVTNVAQSTTGNIYGIYDISGGTFEYVMGNFSNTTGNSGITMSNINAKYINLYTVYSNSVYGDAVWETSSSSSASTSWYGDYSSMPANTSYPWFVRGGGAGYSTNAGAFNFNYANGGTSASLTFRPVILVEAGL